MPDEVAEPHGRGRRWAIVVAVGALALVLIMIILVVRGIGEGDVKATDPTPGSSAPSAASQDPGGTPSPSTPAPPTGSPATSTTAGPANKPSSARPKPQPTRDPVPLETPAEIKPELQAEVTGFEAVEGEATGPGEIAGPAVRFRMVIRNSSAQEVPLGTTVVNLYYGKDRTPASSLNEPGGAPLPAVVPPGAEASGTFLFVVPPKQRGRILITVDYSVEVSLVAFEGAAPR